MKLMQSLFMGATLVAGRAMPSQPQSSLMQMMADATEITDEVLQKCIDGEAAVTAAKEKAKAKDAPQADKDALKTACDTEDMKKCVNAKPKAKSDKEEAGKKALAKIDEACGTKKDGDKKEGSGSC